MILFETTFFGASFGAINHKNYGHKTFYNFPTEDQSNPI